MRLTYLVPTLFSLYTDGEASEASEASEVVEAVDVLTKAQAERLVADQTKALRESHQRALEEVEAIKSKATLTAQERNELEQRLETIKNEVLSKEELSKKKESDARKAHQIEIDTLTKSRDSWQTLYKTETIARILQDAAIENGSVNPAQIVSMLERSATLEEVLDNGEPTGKYAVKVPSATKDASGNEIRVMLSAKDAIKAMSDDPNMANLFKGKGTGGLGGNNHQGTVTDINRLKQDPKAYRAARKAGKI